MNNFEMIAIIISVISIFISSVCFYFTIKIKKRYEKLVMRLGNGEPLNEILKKYTNDEELQNFIVHEVKNLSVQLAPYKRPVNIVVRKEPFPRTATRKVKRNIVKEQTMAVV